MTRQEQELQRHMALLEAYDAMEPAPGFRKDDASFLLMTRSAGLEALLLRLGIIDMVDLAEAVNDAMSQCLESMKGTTAK